MEQHKRRATLTQAEEEQIRLGIGIDLPRIMEQVVSDVESQAIRIALGQANGSVAHAAQLLRMRRSTFYYKLTKYRL